MREDMFGSAKPSIEDADKEENDIKAGIAASLGIQSTMDLAIEASLVTQQQETNRCLEFHAEMDEQISIRKQGNSFGLLMIFSTLE
jgi:hypothetical protein